MLITKEKLNLAKYAPKQDPRLPLENLYLKGNQATVCDGAILLQITDSAETRPPDADFPDTGIEGSYTPDDLISQATAAKVIKNLPKKPPLPVLEHALIGKNAKGIKFGCTDLETSITISQRGIEGHYPDTDAKIPPPSEEMKVIVLDVGLLEKVVKALKEFSPKENWIRIYKHGTVEDETGKLVIKCKNESGVDMIALIMGKKGE